MTVPHVIAAPSTAKPSHYYDNSRVEYLCTQYVLTGCTDIKLRDEVMAHTDELIRQIIATHQLHKICPGQGDTRTGDLPVLAWMQIERTLYKFQARPHCASCFVANQPDKSVLYTPSLNEYGIITPREIAERGLKCPQCECCPPVIIYKGRCKLFNCWSQIARTVILAWRKKELRDQTYAERLHVHQERCTPSRAGVMDEFVKNANELFKHDASMLSFISAIHHLFYTDPDPSRGLIGKLAIATGLSRAGVKDNLWKLRVLGHDLYE